jgi:hypothetical protein
MTDLKKETVLQRVPDLKIQIDSSNTIKIYFEGRVIQCGIHGLAILDASTNPLPSMKYCQVQMKIKECRTGWTS